MYFAPNDGHNLVSSFNRLLHQKNPTPFIFQFGKILGSLVKIKCYHTAISLHRQMELGYDPNVITLTTLIKGLCLKGRIDQALHFHDKLVALGFCFNHVSYGTFLGFMFGTACSGSLMHRTSTRSSNF
ncbi:PPR repeat protein [Medicago truncatula]|uniref:PPR repeat protein n=1 Tax=Medicago truncatula TaxID=3880 RepID=G7KJB7_MEDTR|nr:PPR repeat protein [Medicago truncatula]